MSPLRIQRTFAAQPDAVFDAWTSVAVLRRWWPAGPDWTTSAAEVDPRVGGRLRLVMRDPDGTDVGGSGRYLEIERPTRLVFTWKWDDRSLGAGEQRVEVTFAEDPDGGTTVVLVNHGLADQDQPSHQEGWQLSFDNLDLALAEAQRS